tara:strand:+ start:16993 stop:17262 length:270 start_codon:yes stop_codon:yes gene_type:complete
MAKVVFTQNLRRHVDVESCEVNAETVEEALEAVFGAHPKLRSYLLDDRGSVRKHIAIVVDGTSIQDREKRQDPISATSEIFVMQALSGG